MAEGVVEFFRVAQLEKVVGSGEDDGFKGFHVAPVGFGVDGPEVGIDADDGEGHGVKERGHGALDIEGEHLVEGAHGDGGVGGRHVGGDPFAEGLGRGRHEHGLDKGTAGG